MRSPRASSMGLLGAAGLLALCGCTTTWSRPHTSIAEFERDDSACRHMSTRIVVVSPALTRDYVGRADYKRCMEDEGYTIGGPWPGGTGWTDE